MQCFRSPWALKNVETSAPDLFFRPFRALALSGLWGPERGEPGVRCPWAESGGCLADKFGVCVEWGVRGRGEVKGCCIWESPPGVGVAGGDSEESSELPSCSWNVSGESANRRVRFAGRWGKRFGVALGCVNGAGWPMITLNKIVSRDSIHGFYGGKTYGASVTLSGGSGGGWWPRRRGEV